MKKTTYVFAACIILFILNVWDYGITMFMLDLGGREMNPLMAPIIGTLWAPFIKIVLVAAACIFVARYARSKFAIRMLSFVVLYYVGVVSWNTASAYFYFN